MFVLGPRFRSHLKEMFADKVSLFKHDCDNCVLLGSKADVDVYFCLREDLFVLRYGDSPEAFSSYIPTFLEEPDCYLFNSSISTAREVAIEAGLILAC